MIIKKIYIKKEGHKGKPDDSGKRRKRIWEGRDRKVEAGTAGESGERFLD